MPEIDLNFIARQLANLIGEIRILRDEVHGVQAALRSVRDEVGILRSEVGLLREENRATSGLVRRLDDTINMNVLERLQALEADRGAER